MRVLGVDVGSGSVRAAIIEFNDGQLNGQPIATATKSITIHNPKPDHYEQKTDEIWNGVCQCVKECLASDRMLGHQLAGIAFSATCSLVIVERNSSANDVIMWMDHRAIDEANQITGSKNEVLQQFGGTCSPEFSLAKLAWLNNKQKSRFNNALGFMELPDWLTWKCTEFADPHNMSVKDFPRSLCSVVCKWGYDAEKRRWRDDLFTLIGLDDLLNDKTKIGTRIAAPGTLIDCLSARAANELGLSAGGNSIERESVAIASPLIDAHAGVLAMIALFSNQTEQQLSDQDSYETIFCMIAGTSTCDMISTRSREFTSGVWGPYYEAIFPGYYTREAGQSATGKLVEHVIRSHPEMATGNKVPLENLIKELNEKILTGNCQNRSGLRNKIHINPSFHGNRSPLAKPELRGGVYGLTLKETSLIDWYEAAIESLAYESKFILDELRIPQLKSVLISGGLAKNQVYMQIHADVFNAEVFTFSVGEADLMLVGAAILAHQAVRRSDLSCSQLKTVSFPQMRLDRYQPRVEMQRYHNLKYKCYRELLDSALKIERIMDQLF